MSEHPTTTPPVDVVGLIVSFELGAASNAEMLTLFGELIRTGQAWTLQGAYGRAATHLIEAGYLDEQGARTELGDALAAWEG